MSVIEIVGRRDEITQRQRWSHYFVLIYGVIALLIGVNLRDSALNATVPYANSQVGIRAYYPQNWLLDSDGPYVFRVRDMSQRGFKTTIQLDVQPVAINTTARNLLDQLILSRAQTLSAYSVLAREPYILPDEREATAMTYTFVESETNPFLESLPIVVEGLDIITIQRGQAIIMTFLSDASTYESNLPTFERFVNDLEF
jgi:hypothetical protein